MRMKYLLSLLLVPVMAYGRDVMPDSIPAHELTEVTVTAATQRADATRTVYMPTARQRDTAADGISLLSRMGITQLSINPISGTVRTADNQEVSLFINSHPASDEDMSGLNPVDVRRVEYLGFPADARFLRAAHVVNIITRGYAYGGYTKMSGKERFGIRSGEASVYSKFAYRQMEYDLMVSGNYDYNRHIGTVSDETYRLDGGTVRRVSETTGARHRERELFAALRASWSRDEALSLRNLISYRIGHAPVNETEGYVTISDTYAAERYSTSSPYTGNALEWNSELYAQLGQGWSLNGTLDTDMRHNSTTENYMTAASQILNHADENAWFINGKIQIDKAVSDRITLFANAMAGGGRTRIAYTGSSNAVNRFSQTFAGACLGASFNAGHFAGSADGGYALESNSINGIRNDDRYPFTHINIQYAPDQRNTLGLWFQYATMSPDATMKNPNIIRQTELMYVSGNAALRRSRHISANLSYTWLPDNRWQMTAYAVLFRIIDRQIAVYTPDGPDGMMLKRYQNDGDYNHGQLGARLTGHLADGRLSVTVAPRLLLYRTTGSNSVAHYPLTCSVSADYYLGHFFLNLYCDTGSSYVDGETSYLRRMPPGYSIGAGWAHRGWNIQLDGVNLLQSSWRVSDDTLTTRWYDSTVTQTGPYSHRRISLSVTYTFTYGRRVSTSSELTGTGTISSSRLR